MTNTYVALLRGINVGGNNKVEMAKLKTTFEALGCQKVSTYINSGNVIFQDSRTAKALMPLIEKAIKKDFKLAVRVVVRDFESIEKLAKAIPAKWTNDSKLRTDVMFLWPEIDNKDILKKVVFRPELEKMRYMEGALVWHIGRENVTRGAAVKLVKSDTYKHMTIRNINTVRKLDQLMRQASEK